MGKHDVYDVTEDDKGLPNEESRKNIFLWLFRILALSMPTKGEEGLGARQACNISLSKFRTVFNTYLNEDGNEEFALGQAHWKM